ncbi:hypothetical protein C8J57DRAFT_1528959 [Mycena rebaudengoi]|nr:hypothetical protein C8J57DRAFT_1528959 [Mycena rebaudengoi]
MPRFSSPDPRGFNSEGCSALQPTLLAPERRFRRQDKWWHSHLLSHAQCVPTSLSVTALCDRRVAGAPGSRASIARCRVGGVLDCDYVLKLPGVPMEAGLGLSDALLLSETGEQEGEVVEEVMVVVVDEGKI